MVLATTPVRGLVVLPTAGPQAVAAKTFDLYITVPCNFNTSIAVSVGGREVEISHESFNLGPVSEGSDTCVAGAASEESLTDSKLASDILR
jgi:hypothetical protein